MRTRRKRYSAEFEHEALKRASEEGMTDIQVNKELGANYQSIGYYHSELDCMMFTRTTRFCQVCANAIE